MKYTEFKDNYNRFKSAIDNPGTPDELEKARVMAAVYSSLSLHNYTAFYTGITEGAQQTDTEYNIVPIAKCKANNINSAISEMIGSIARYSLGPCMLGELSVSEPKLISQNAPVYVISIRHPDEMYDFAFTAQIVIAQTKQELVSNDELAIPSIPDGSDELWGDTEADGAAWDSI